MASYWYIQTSRVCFLVLLMLKKSLKIVQGDFNMTAENIKVEQLLNTLYLDSLITSLACSKSVTGQFHRCRIGQSEENVSNIEEHFLIVIFGPSIIVT